MNHAGVGQINRDGTLSFPSDIIKPLSITNNVMVWGIYYPNLQNKNQSIIKHDFVLTPIPFDLWPKTGSFIIQSRHISGAFEVISDCILEFGGSILLSEASRSAYRYDTWSMIIAFNVDKPNSQLTYDEKIKVYLETLDRRIVVFISECGKVNFL